MHTNARNMILALALSAGLLIPVLAATAQGDGPADLPSAEPVTLAASADGLTLVGDFYPALPVDEQETAAPAVLLLHMLGSDREAWAPLIPALHEAGYAVLAVDMRGHGETGGAQDWPLAEQDVADWLAWLRAQDGVDAERVNLVGASIGANLALRGLANDDTVVTAVALSPGLDYRGVTTEDAVAAVTRPLMLVAGQGDRYSAESVRALGAALQGAGLVRFYASGLHGTQFLPQEPSLEALIIHWLDWQNRP
ncbi:MAG: hypothetical protein Kow0077_11290 [Anaerolineae bacterium]